MAQTLLQLVNQAQSEMGIAVSSTVISNTTLSVIQQLNLLNGVGQDLQREFQWQGITKEYRFTTVYYQYTATTTADSTTISALSDTTGLTSTPTYFLVTGTGINQDTYLVSVNAGASTAVLSQAATASGTVTLTFSQAMYTFPSDYDRPVNRTQWDKSDRWELLGPETAQEWQWLKSGYIATGPRARYRPLGSLFQVWPAIANNLYFGFEYVSNQWVGASTPLTLSKTAFAVDTDVCVFPDRLMIESLKLRFKKATGADLSAYSRNDIETGFPTRLLDIAKANDAGARTLSFAPRFASPLIGWENIPDGNYNI